MYNISVFSTTRIIPIETNFECTQWTYDSFRETTVYRLAAIYSVLYEVRMMQAFSTEKFTS